MINYFDVTNNIFKSRDFANDIRIIAKALIAISNSTDDDDVEHFKKHGYKEISSYITNKCDRILIELNSAKNELDKVIYSNNSEQN